MNQSTKQSLKSIRISIINMKLAALMMVWMAHSISTKFINTDGSVTTIRKVDYNQLHSMDWIKRHDWDDWLHSDCFFSDSITSVSTGNPPSPDFFFSPTEFDSLDVTPFLTALKRQSRISILKFKNSRNFVVCLVIAIFAGIFFLLALYHLGCVSKNKRIRVSAKCFKFCTILVLFFLFAVVVCFFVAIKKGLVAKRIEQEMLCEALRVPMTLMNGNAQSALAGAGAFHFVGFRQLRKWVSSFLDQFQDFSSGQNHEHLKILSQVQFESDVQKLVTTVDDFYQKYHEQTVPDLAGVQHIPPSIRDELEFYHSKMVILGREYLSHAKRVNGLGDIFSLLKDAQSKEVFRGDLEGAETRLLDVEAGFLEFWDAMLKLTLIAPGTQKSDVNSILWISGLSLLVVCFNLSIFLRNYCQNKLKSIQGYRGVLLFLGLLLIVCAGMCLEVLQSVYTTHYGCGFLHHLLNGRSELIADVETDFNANPEAKLVIDLCYSSSKESASKGIYSLLKDEGQVEALAGYLEFLDGLKTVDDDKQAVNHLTDEYQTVFFGNRLEQKRKGQEQEFRELSEALDKLNQLVSCGNVVYSWTSETCKKAQESKEQCVKIETGEYVPIECVEQKDHAKSLFEQLQRHFQVEVKLMSEMIEGLLPESNPDSVMHHLVRVWTSNNYIYEKVGEVEGNLKVHFQTLDDGELHNWLNCSLIKQDLEAVYNGVCLSRLVYGVRFADFCSVLMVLMFVLIVLSYALTLLDFKTVKMDEQDYGQFNDMENYAFTGQSRRKESENREEPAPRSWEEDEMEREVENKEMNVFGGRERVNSDLDNTFDEDSFIPRVSQNVAHKRISEIDKKSDFFEEEDDDIFSEIKGNDDPVKVLNED